MTKISILFAGIALILILSLNHAHSQSSTETEFITSFDNPCCDADTGLYWWLGGKMLPSLHNCYIPIVGDGCSDTCCPNSNCNRESGECEFTTTPIESCLGYKNQEDCNHASDNIIAADGRIHLSPHSCDSSWIDESSGIQCEISISDCACFWDSDNTCQFSNNFTENCSGTITTMGKCVFNTKDKSNCTGGFKVVGWTAILFPPDAKLPAGVECKDNTKTVKCLFSELGFFTDSSIVVATALIVIFYLLSIARKIKRRKNQKISLLKKY